jgi:RNA polymerase sigma factor (sigma-70 family)
MKNIDECATEWAADVSYLGVDVLWPTVAVYMTRPTFAEFYRAEYAKMVRVAWLIVGSREAAEDLVQDVFLRVGRRYDSIDSPSAYLRVGVVNACRNELRRNRRLSSGPLPEVVTNDPETVELFEGLKLLDPKQRAALVLRYVDDRPYEEIADLLGVRLATVRSLVHRGLVRLREVTE